jgi:predicted transcriptional regulator of viral defense system
MEAIDIRAQIKTEIFDYQTLIDILKDLSSPRDKITDLLRQEIIIRVKKGLYVFAPKYRTHPYSKELLANLIHGPSYLSLDYALAYYGVIPERVKAVTSVTPNRSRRFNTPVGLFIYRQIPAAAYETGQVRTETDHEQAFLIATPEKALADKIVSLRGLAITSAAEMQRFLEEDLRIELDFLKTLPAARIDDFARRYHSRKLRYLSQLVRQLQKAREINHE